MKIVLLFPGYGSQFVGMSKELYDEYRIVQEYFEEAAHVLNINFVKLCFASSDAELGKLVNAYSSLFLVSASIYAVLKENGIEPDVVTGYNNGESAALLAAGSFSFPDGLYLVHKFCLFYQEFIDRADVDGMMVAGIATIELENLCKQINETEENVSIAIYNNMQQHIVTGKREQLEQLHDMFDAQVKTEYIGPEVGLHSSLMNEVLELFKHFLEKINFKNLDIPLISCIDGKNIATIDDVKEYILKHINTSLQWNKAAEELIDYDCIVIAGVSHKLSEMLKIDYPEKLIVSIAKKADIDKLKEMIKNKDEETGLTNDN